jgi:hypothetical protein
MAVDTVIADRMQVRKHQHLGKGTALVAGSIMPIVRLRERLEQRQFIEAIRVTPLT